MKIEDIALHLKRLHARMGVFAVIGNHDRWENERHISETLEGAGIPVLENTNIALSTPKGEIRLVGIGDFDTDASNPSRALRGIPDTSVAICFTHSPAACAGAVNRSTRPRVPCRLGRGSQTLEC